MTCSNQKKTSWLGRSVFRAEEKGCRVYTGAVLSIATRVSALTKVKDVHIACDFGIGTAFSV